MSEYTSKDLAKTAFLALEDKKGFDVRVIEIEKVSTIADYFVIADGSNASNQPRQCIRPVEEPKVIVYFIIF